MMKIDTFLHNFEKLLSENGITIDRPKGSRHPRYPDYAYPMDYGFINNTVSGDGHGIDVWVGSLGGNDVTGIIVTLDLLKRDSEIKVLAACTNEEMQIALNKANNGGMSGILIKK